MLVLPCVLPVIFSKYFPDDDINGIFFVLLLHLMDIIASPFVSNDMQLLWLIR
jgi:hypothetical protein